MSFFSVLGKMTFSKNYQEAPLTRSALCCPVYYQIGSKGKIV